ncbi:Non-specific serine/threonine protein kinase [Ascochyta rabiei]|uniref:non-specific serine/threonine protein kinase n=1 Tax=Didymella rabiei TaxID=5454 RepID=A0A163EDC8_DIDRA|nr:Non-specific serine/threonine protein kinase [Ascochyta rabiei]KZM23645.1 transferase [Ascochyta rabiei]UPX09425.1 Non-specific serine/threonine protein kinase [Ascochyta rabiei]
MPPRIVYGKKATARPVSASYIKFLSPGEDQLFSSTNKEEVQTQTNKGSSQSARTTEERIQDELVALEAQLGGLAIDNDIIKQDGLPVEKKLTSRSRKVLEDRDANTVPKKTSEHIEKPDKAELKGTTQPTELATPPQTPVARPRKKRSKPTTTKKRAQPPTPESTPEHDDVHVRYISPLFSFSDGKRITTFEQWSSELEPHFKITKIAEASFSEVYRLSAISATAGLGEESVLKVVALKTPPEAPLPCQTLERAIRDRKGQMAKELEEREEKDAYKSHVADVLSEVKLLQNLNQIPGFTNFRALTVLQGRPSSSFNNAWKVWNKARPRGKKSYFPDPSKKTSYEDTQLWAVIEMQDAGMDCEKLMESEGLGTIWEVWDVFWGVCMSVAKAEEACQFEHRDLHMGNICVRSSRPESDVAMPTAKDPLRRRFRFTGLETTVIDYTLSRADIVTHQQTPTSSPSTLDAASQPRPHFTGNEVAYLDLNKDPALFEGDAAEEYQYEIYRYMRGAALYDNPLQSEPCPEPKVPTTPRPAPKKNIHIRFGEIPETPQKPSLETATDTNVWRRFHPKTNLVWTHFLLHKLLNHLKGYEPEHQSTTDIMANVDLGDDASIPGAALRVKKKAIKLHRVLQRVSELLCPVALGQAGSLKSVKELVILAVEERWLRVGDVSG